MLLLPYFPTQKNKEVAYFGLHIANRLITSKNGELLYDALFSQYVYYSAHVLCQHPQLKNILKKQKH